MQRRVHVDIRLAARTFSVDPTAHVLSGTDTLSESASKRSACMPISCVRSWTTGCTGKLFLHVYTLAYTCARDMILSSAAAVSIRLPIFDRGKLVILRYYQVIYH